MGDNIYLGDRNGVRTPDAVDTPTATPASHGAIPARLYFPVIMDPIYGYQVVNVEAQLSDQSSLLHWTRNMIALRKLFQVFGPRHAQVSGPGEPQGPRLPPRPRPRRRLARDGPLRGQSQPVCPARLAGSRRFAGMVPVEMLGYVPFPDHPRRPTRSRLAPYSFLWLELQTRQARTRNPASVVLDC